MKMSEIDHTNSLDQDQAQQNVWQDLKEKGPSDLKNVQDKNTLLSMQRIKTKRCYIFGTRRYVFGI